MSESTDRATIQRLVSGQYDRYPYPAVQDSLADFIARNAVQAGCPSAFFHRYWPFRNKRLDLDILVAGCGTQQAAKFAVNLPAARITAIDISAGSIGNTQRLLDRHGLGNVETRQLAIEDVAELGREFDLVVSTGVLHHLHDPGAGLAALRGVLRRDGSMYLMLYGKYGRDGVYGLQDLFRRCGLAVGNVTPQDLLAIRQLLDRLPAQHPAAAKRHFFNDYRVGDEELVDLFLHPCDRGYSLPDIVALLDDCDLRLQSILQRAHYAPRCCGLFDSGLGARIARLPDIEQLAIGELFRAAVHMHFFIACRKDRDTAGAYADLDAADWKTLIPVRGMALLQETAGTGITLRSAVHQFSDLHYRLQGAELALFGLVNDSLDIGTIQSAAARLFPELAADEPLRAFFDTMFDYDFLSFRGRPA